VYRDRKVAAKKHACRPQTRYAIGYYFLTLGLFNGVFSGLMPALEDHYAMSETQLSYMLLVMCVGGVVAMFSATTLSGRFGTGVSVDVPAFVLAANFPLIIFFPANRKIGAFVTGTLWGFCAGLIEIVLSSQAVLYESSLDASAMGFFHALCAAGSVGGSVIAGTLIFYGVHPETICFSVSAAVLLCNIWFRKGLIPQDLERVLMELQGAEEGHAQKEAMSRELLSEFADMNEDSASASGDNGDIELSARWDERDDADRDDTALLAADERDYEYSPPAGSGSASGKSRGRASSLTARIAARASRNTTQSSNSGTGASSGMKGVARAQWSLLALLTAVSFIDWMTEGSIADWSALYSTKVLKVSEARATVPYAVFQVSEVLGRSFYDRIVDKYVSKRSMIALNGVLGGGGILIVVIAGSLAQASERSGSTLGSGIMPSNMAYYFTLLGFAVSGFGFSLSWPLVTSWSGSLAGIDPTYAISIVNGVGYTALLAGPPLLGFVADYSGSLVTSFAVEAGISLLCIPLAYLIGTGTSG